MAVVKGREAVVSVAASDLSAFITSAKFNRSVDALDITCLGATGKRYVSGLTDGTFSIEGIYDTTAVSGPGIILRAAIQDDTTAVLWKPEGTGTGKLQLAFNGILTSYEESSPVAEMCTWTAEFNIDGAVTSTSQS